MRVFGPINGAGVSVTELAPQALVTPASLGVTGYVGILEKGPLNKVITVRNPTEMAQKAGGRIIESFLPGVCGDFFKTSQGAGELNLVRVTDGSHKTSSKTFKSRQTPIRTDVIDCFADSPGKHGGKKQVIVGQYASVTNTTLSTGKTMEVDEFKGGIVTLSELPGKSFIVQSNDVAGVLTFAPDTTLADQLTLSGGGDLTFGLTLLNNGKATSVLFKNGTDSPESEFAIEVFSNGVSVKFFDNLSMDPDAANYFVPIVNDDSSNYWLSVADTFTGTLSSDVRPANFSGISKSLSSLTLGLNASEIQTSSTSGSPTAEMDEVLGSEIIQDQVTLTVTTAGTRPEGSLSVGTNPSDDDTLTLDFSAIDGLTGTKVITFKNTVTDAESEVLIGVDANATATNLHAFLEAMTYASGRFSYTLAAPLITVVALNANDLHNSGTQFTESATNFTLVQVGTGVAGVDKVLSYVSSNQPDLPATTITPGKPFSAPNGWLIGGTFNITSDDDLLLADTAILTVDPLPINELVGGFLIPDATQRRKRFQIVSNTANSVTVKSGSVLTDVADAGDQYIIEAAVELGGGYDGVASISDQDYIDAWDIDTSPFNSLAGKNKGLIKYATPGVTSVSVEKAGRDYANAKNHQYRAEFPSNITTEDAAEEYVNDTLGRDNYMVASLPSFGFKKNPDAGGNILVPMTGMIHGREALVARNFQGFFKAAAGIDVTLPDIVSLPTGDKVLDEEVLNPQGIGVIKFKEGNAIIWGDRMLSLSTGFTFKHQREYLSHIEHILLENFDFLVFALNNSATQTELLNTLTIYFEGQFALGAFDGQKFKDAVRIKVDSENNTEATKALGDLNGEIAVKIVNTVERVRFIIGQAGIGEDLAAE